MTIHDCAQRTDEWRAMRAGRLTGSRAKAMLAKIKTGEAAARRDLRLVLVTERLTGRPEEDGYLNAVMQWGIDQEPMARAAYEGRTGQLVETVGFCAHDTLAAGVSPDGLVGDDGAVSIKCPKSATHVGYLRERDEPAEHWAQHTHELWITGRAWMDFVSFDPRLPDALQLHIVRLTRPPAQLEAYEAQVVAFLAECDHEEAALRTMMEARRAKESR